MDMKKTVRRYSKEQIKPYIIIGVGAFDLIDLEDLKCGRLRAKTFIDRVERVTKNTCTIKWFQAEKDQNKLKMLQAYQIAIDQEAYKQNLLQYAYHEWYTSIRARENLIESKRNYGKAEVIKLKNKAVELKKLQLRVMEKKYKTYHEKLFPNNPFQILRNQFLLKNQERIMELDENGQLRMVLHTEQEQQKGQHKDKKSLAKKKDFQNNFFHNKANIEHNNPYEQTIHKKNSVVFQSSISQSNLESYCSSSLIKQEQRQSTKERQKNQEETNQFQENLHTPQSHGNKCLLEVPSYDNDNDVSFQISQSTYKDQLSKEQIKIKKEQDLKFNEKQQQIVFPSLSIQKEKQDFELKLVQGHVNNPFNNKDIKKNRYYKSDNIQRQSFQQQKNQKKTNFNISRKSFSDAKQIKAILKDNQIDKLKIINPETLPQGKKDYKLRYRPSSATARNCNIKREFPRLQNFLKDKNQKRPNSRNI